jgi:hypothetical protein
MRCALTITALVLATSIVGAGTIAQSAEPNRNASIANATAEQFLSSLADKFGTNVDQLQKLLSKIPPHGRGLNGLELMVISARLGLSKEEKAVLKSRIGSGGTGFTNSDLVGMGARLGLNSTEIARLGDQLGLASPTIATRTLFSPAVIERTADGMAQQATTVDLESSSISLPAPIMIPKWRCYIFDSQM